MSKQPKDNNIAEDKWLMSTTLFARKPDSVDMEKGIIEGISLVTEGEALGHGVWLDSDFVKSTVNQGNGLKQGLKVRFGHPNMSSTALGTFMGRAKNFRKIGNIAKADIFLSNSSKDAPGGNLWDYVLKLAKDDPEAFGLSIVFDIEKKYQLDEIGEKEYTDFAKDNKTFVELKKLNAVDFVDSPAANPGGLFSQFNKGTMAAQMTEFIDTHPEILELVANDTTIIDKFMSRYDNYLKLKNGGYQMPKDTKPEVKPEPKPEIKPELKPEPKPEGDSEETPNEELSEVSKFIALADAEGLDFAKINFGKSYLDVMKAKIEKLEKENKALKETKTVQKTKTDTGEEPLAFSEDDATMDIMSIVKEKKKAGLSATVAWSQAKKENPEMYNKQIMKKEAK